MTSCLLAWFWRTRIKSLLSSAFNTRSKSRTLGTAGSVMIVDLSINGMLALEKIVVWREKTRLASPEVGLRRFQRFDDAIQGEPRFLLLTRSRRQTGEALLAGCKWCEEWSFNFPCTNVFQEWHLLRENSFIFVWGNLSTIEPPCTTIFRKRLRPFIQVFKAQKFPSNNPIVKTSRKRLRPLFSFFNFFLCFYFNLLCEPSWNYTDILT